ncbi:MAG: sigma-70 family RNA polymerase sigma factor [Planctomycetia bacterium]|nr:MAG: sigma-70 family RNA polymerase sigma factor [Planctomycetia bacterium]
MTTTVPRQRADIESVWKKFHRTRSVTYRNQLVEHYVGIVNKLAEIMARRLWPRVSADELASAGYDGLIAAVSAFDPARGVKFETYCRQRIVGAIRDWQREIDPLGRSGRNFERTMNSVEERYQAEAGHPATSVEVAKRMGLSHGKFVKMKKTVLASHCVPLESATERFDDSRVASLVPADPNPGPVHHTERELIREYLTRGLKEQDRLIITLYYYEKLTMAEIGQVLGVSESRVCQRHADIVDQLRTRFADVPCDMVA